MFMKKYKQYLCALCVVISVYIISRNYRNSLGIEPKLEHELSRNTAQPLSTERKTTKSTFIYSETELFQTILDIRQRNCRQEHYGDNKFCQDLRQCNNAERFMPPSLPTCKRRLPRCIIIGVFKAGTREVIDFLMMHPQIIIKKKPVYEISFFSNHWERGLDGYRGAMPFSMPEQITIEKSPHYFMSFETPGRIRDTIPDVKLILIVRDPVERAISHTTFFYSKRRAKRMLDDYIKDPRNASHVILNSIYDEPVQRYLQHFNRSQLHVIDSEMFKHDPYGVLRDIETYLGLPNVIKKTDFEFNEESGFFCLRRVNQPYPVCFGQNRGRQKMGDEFVEYKPPLRRIFKPHNDRFFELVGQKFNWP